MAKTLEQLVDDFADAVAKRDELTFQGTGKGAIKYSKKAVQYRKAIWKYGDEGREALARLLSHPIPRVRAEAAAYLLGYKTEEAMAVLQEVAKYEGYTGWGARETIERWEKDPKPIV